MTTRPMNPQSRLFPEAPRPVGEYDPVRFLGLFRGPVIKVGGPVECPLPMNPTSVLFPVWRPQTQWPRSRPRRRSPYR